MPVLQWRFHVYFYCHHILFSVTFLIFYGCYVVLVTLCVVTFADINCLCVVTFADINCLCVVTFVTLFVCCYIC